MALPLCDQVRMHPVAGRQLGQRLIAPKRLKELRSLAPQAFALKPAEIFRRFAMS